MVRMEMYCNLKKIGFFFPVVPYVLQKSLKTDYGLLSLVETRKLDFFLSTFYEHFVYDNSVKV